MVARIPSHGASRGMKQHEIKREQVKEDPRSARPWRRLRARILRRDKYTCRKCGTIDPHGEVDHIIPRHDKGTDDESNLQTLCHLCHKVKTLVENGVRTASMCPEWMPKPTKPLFLVAGRPGAGKSRWVDEHKTSRDLVVDLALMANEMSRKLHDLTDAERAALIRLRNERIGRFCNGQTQHERCYVVATSGRPFMRDYWKNLGAEVIIVDAPLEVCQRRIVGGDEPPRVKEQRLQAAQDWA